MSNKTSLIIGIAVVALVVFGIIVVVVLTKEPSYTPESLDTLAQCLTDEGVVMYGAYWCPHCRDTKRRFGESFQYVTYVECDPDCVPDSEGSIPSFCGGKPGQPELCLELDIQNYDTWIFGDNSRVVGEPSFQTLSEKSGCPMPVEK